MNTYRALFFVTAAAFLTACHPRVPRPAAGPGTAGHVLARAVGVSGQVRTLKGEAKLTVHSPKANGTVSVNIWAERPARLHLEVMDFFGRPLAALVSDGVRFGVYQAQEGVYYQGPASAANVSQFLPVELDPAALVALLMGEAPLEPARAADVLEDGDDGWRLVRHLSKGTQTLSVDASSGRIVRSQEQAGPRGDTDLRFEDLDSATRFFFPRKLKLKASGLSTSMELRYQSVTLNALPDPGIFAPVPPEHVRVVDVDEEGRPTAAGS